MGKLKKTPIFRNPLFLTENSKLKNNENGIDRKKALKACIRKLRHISDAESKLHQAVLLNNTLQRIKEAKDNLNCDTKSNNNEIIMKDKNLWNNEAGHDLFSEIHLPPPLNTNQLELLSTNNLNFEEHLQRHKELSYYHTITNYHLEEEINLFESHQYFIYSQFFVHLYNLRFPHLSSRF